MLSTILLVFAFVLTMIASFIVRPNVSSSPIPWRLPHMGWLGISFWILSILLSGVGLR